MAEVFAGRYEILAPIAASSARSVRTGSRSAWFVRDLENGAISAARILPQTDAYSLLRIVRKYAPRMEHPHVLIPTTTQSERGRLIFPMPLAEGGSLAGLLQRHGPLPPLFVAELLLQLLDALESVHEASLVHRDIRPANLLLRATGYESPWLYLSDFESSIATDAPRVTRTGHVLSDPTYMAPEVRSGGEPSTASDLWAVGAVAEELLTGELTSGRPVPHLPVSTPSALVELIVGLLSPVPDRRPSVAEASELLAGVTWAPIEGPGVYVPDHHADNVARFISSAWSRVSPAQPGLTRSPGVALPTHAHVASQPVATTHVDPGPQESRPVEPSHDRPSHVEPSHVEPSHVEPSHDEPELDRDDGATAGAIAASLGLALPVSAAGTFASAAPGSAPGIPAPAIPASVGSTAVSSFSPAAGADPVRPAAARVAGAAAVVGAGASAMAAPPITAAPITAQPITAPPIAEPPTARIPTSAARVAARQRLSMSGSSASGLAGSGLAAPALDPPAPHGGPDVTRSLPTPNSARAAASTPPATLPPGAPTAANGRSSGGVSSSASPGYVTPPQAAGPVGSGGPSGVGASAPVTQPRSSVIGAGPGELSWDDRPRALELGPPPPRLIHPAGTSSGASLRRGWITAALLVLALILLLLLLFRDGRRAEVQQSPPSSSPSAESSQGASSVEPTALPTSPSAGKLETRTVVMRTGQPCTSEGARETTVQGVAVICRSRNSSLAWLAAP